MPCLRPFQPIRRTLFDFSKRVSAPSKSQVYRLNVHPQQGSSKLTGMFQTLLGLSLLMVPFVGQALNSEPVTKCKQLEEEQYHVVKPIIDDILTLARLQQMGLKRGPILICLSGPTGGGKTTLADILREYLLYALRLQDNFVEVGILHGDDCLNPIPPKDALPIHPNLDQELAHRIFTQLARGDKTIHKPVWVWDENVGKCVLKEETLDTRGIGIWFIEFEFSCFKKEYDFHRYADFHILLDTPTDLAAEWVLERKRNMPEDISLEECRAQVARNIERYKGYLRECMGEVRYILTPDKQHHLTLKKHQTDASTSFTEKASLLALW